MLVHGIGTFLATLLASASILRAPAILLYTTSDEGACSHRVKVRFDLRPRWAATRAAPECALDASTNAARLRRAARPAELALAPLWLQKTHLPLPYPQNHTPRRVAS